MNLSPHFSLDEFTATAHRGIDNSLPDSLLPQAKLTADLMEKIRAHLGVPIIVTSGYRCIALNRAIGSADTSDHPKAMAVDFKAPSFGTPFAVATELAEHADALGIGQLIHEFGRWVHVSTRMPIQTRNRVITISAAGTVGGIVPA
ncbi:MAG: peptidase [Variovorax sp.]|nr:peptidase [Variovorax sp.]